MHVDKEFEYGIFWSLGRKNLVSSHSLFLSNFKDGKESKCKPKTGVVNPRWFQTTTQIYLNPVF